MSKDKKKKKDGGKAKKSSATKSLKTLATNPVVGEVIAAALVAAASALKDSNKARRLAEHAGDELKAMTKKNADRGNAMWQLALDIGRQALETIGEETKSKSSKSK